MARPKRLKAKERNEIGVSLFKKIHIHFPGDVYLLAVWVAMSDRVRSTPTCKAQTTLHGLARAFVAVYGIDYSHPLSCDDVMDIFHGHGIKGNPGLRLDEADQHNLPHIPCDGEQ